jgi:hypothetical protein
MAFQFRDPEQKRIAFHIPFHWRDLPIRSDPISDLSLQYRLRVKSEPEVAVLPKNKEQFNLLTIWIFL